MIFRSQLLAMGSGSVGGLTASHNKGGYYFKTRTAPTNPNSARQQATRALLGKYASWWTVALNETQRGLWNAYAQTHTIKNSLGVDIYINGISWYIMFNCRLEDAGLTPTPAPPPGAAPAPLATFACDISAANTVDVVFTPVLPGGHVIQLWMTLPGSSGQTPNFKQARLVGYSPADQATPWAATLPFGVQQTEQCTFYGLVMNILGQVSSALVDTDLADYV